MRTPSRRCESSTVARRAQALFVEFPANGPAGRKGRPVYRCRIVPREGGRQRRACHPEQRGV